MSSNRTTTVVVLLVVVAGIVGYKAGFFSRIGGAISGANTITGS